MSEYILIFGSPIDPHVTEVVKYIEKNNKKAFIFDYFISPNESQILFKKGSIALSNSETEIYIDEVFSAWWRVKPVIINNPKNEEDYLSKSFMQREWKVSINSLVYMIRHKFRLNRREVNLIMNNKPLQLDIAKSVGLDIPETLITNSYKDIIAFCNECNGRIIYKPLTYYFEPPDKLLFSNIVTIDYLKSRRKNISVAPGIYQKIIPKKYEYRIMVVESNIIAVKIHSQCNDISIIDWRRNIINVKYEIANIEDSLKNSILEFHKKSNLVYGAYDFIETPEGEFIFLEVNPSGQWLWLEKELDFSLTEKIAQVLCAPYQVDF